MVVDSTVQTSSGYILKATDRCDNCGSQAYILVKGVTGELMFCAHDYTAIMSVDPGKQKMIDFAFEVVDEREKLIENRLIGEN
tara:strand:- start:6044 stop:6292 length:249 start_codon:yes stop_codon:yes gene_type:complete